MENREIISIVNFNDDYHSCDNHVITLSGILATDIIIKFVSTNRNDTSYLITFNSPQREFQNGKTMKYAGLGNLYKYVVKDIKELFINLEIEIFIEEVNKISETICKAINKCESRYGMCVKNFDDNQCDAMVTIMGEDNGKEKYVVEFRDELNEDMLVIDYPIINGYGKVVKEDNIIKWKIDRDSCNYHELISCLIMEFENPYLIIKPNSDIILDFRFDTNKYE